MTHLTGKKVAIIAGDWFEEPELVEPRDRLRAGGAEVLVYAPEGKPIKATQGDVNPTGEVPVDGTYDDLDASAIDALVVPGGVVNADHLRMDERAQRIVREVAAARKPLAVICHGPWLLVSAGLAEGRRLTSWPSLADDLRNAGADWVDEEVVVDDFLITSRKPDDIPAFVDALEHELVGAG